MYSTWYWSPNSCVKQAVSFWMEASAYFWSAACRALGSGVGILVLWGSAGGVLHAARSLLCRLKFGYLAGFPRPFDVCEGAWESFCRSELATGALELEARAGLRGRNSAVAHALGCDKRGEVA